MSEVLHPTLLLTSGRCTFGLGLTPISEQSLEAFPNTGVFFFCFVFRSKCIHVGVVDFIIGIDANFFVLRVME